MRSTIGAGGTTLVSSLELRVPLEAAAPERLQGDGCDSAVVTRARHGDEHWPEHSHRHSHVPGFPKEFGVFTRLQIPAPPPPTFANRGGLSWPTVCAALLEVLVALLDRRAISVENCLHRRRTADSRTAGRRNKPNSSDDSATRPFVGRTVRRDTDRSVRSLPPFRSDRREERPRRSCSCPGRPEG